MCKYRAFLIDLDGTIYKGTKQIEGAKAFIEELQRRKIPFLFVTNNAMRSPAAMAEFLAEHHKIYVEENQFYSSVDALLFELQQAYPTAAAKGKAYVIGTPYLQEKVAEFGLNVTRLWEEANTLIVGLNPKTTYQEIAEAGMAVQNGAAFFLTNPDIQFPSANGFFVPGAGILGNAISLAAGGAEPIICGKPSPTIIKGAIHQLKVSAQSVVMLGDNLKTDIRAAINGEIETILIETGVNKREDVEELGIKPTHIVKNYSELMAKCFQK